MATRKSTQRVREQLSRWREEVINLARTNRLIYFRHLKAGTLEITSPAVGVLLERLDSSGWSIYMPPEPTDDELPVEPPAPGPGELVTHKETARQLQNSLTSLARRTEQEFMDKGLWVLYLGVGMVHWIDEDDQPAESPLLLVPVQLARESPREPYRLVRADEDATINPALQVKLAEFGIALPQLDEVEEKGVDALLARAAAAISGRSDWSIAPRAVVGVFSFQKEVMYRDLLNNEEQIVEHPLVASLALGSAGGANGDLDFEPVPEERLDEDAPPEDLTTILDADASQRQCIVAASHGHSFVMDGPPGTGKSQTIANMIAELLMRGRTVLFVSEKAAALEVVQKRLRQRGLDDFALELHSHKATRREVAQALAQPLTRRTAPGQMLSGANRSRLVKRRKDLSDHAAAMNEVRAPLGMTLQQAIGRAAQLSEAPQLPLARIDHQMTASEFAEAVDLAGQLANAWGPVERGDEFLWREPSASAADPANRAEVAEQLHAAGRALVALRTATRDYADELGVTSWRAVTDARRLGILVDRLLNPVAGEPAWLSASSLAPVHRRVSHLSALSARRIRAAQELEEWVCERWHEVPPRTETELKGLLATLGDSSLEGSLRPTATVAEITGRVRALEDSGSLMAAGQAFVGEASSTLGVDPSDATLVDVRRLAQIVQLFAREPKPEPAWLSPDGLSRARKAASELQPLVERWTELRESLNDVFTESVLDLDLEGLRVRFETVHQGLRKLRGAYREDKKALSAVARAQRIDATVLEKLPEAVEWKRVTAELEDAESRSAPLLAGHYERGKTDFAGIAGLFDAAEQGIRLSGGPGFDQESAGRLGHGGVVPSGLVDQSGRLLGDLATWEKASGEYGALVRQLGKLPCAEATALIDRDLESARAVRDLLRSLSETAARDLSLNEASAIASKRAEVQAMDAEYDASFTSDKALLGPRYSRDGTDWVSLKAALAWADEVRNAAGGPLDPQQIETFLTATLPPEGLAPTLEAWERERASIEGWFAPARQDPIRQELEGVFEDASQLIDALERTLGDLDEWDAHSRAWEGLKEMGFGKGLTQLRKRRSPAADIVGAIERCCLQAWIEAVLKLDAARLRPELLASDRDKLLAEFRRLDRELVERKANEVIEHCNAKRPRGTAGAAGIIMREAEKKRRHMPVRKLLADTGGLALELKPCFLMSPLTVSQFLPADIRFDAVIFDEASQVRPADAINCIYRGDQLIVAGDQRQLPPTSFFERFTQDDGDEYQEDQLEEFDSILDLAKGSGSLRALSLKWHYRSQHESLITYSNYSFYDGRLISFPGALEAAEDVGVKLFPVEGVYRRGGARDNPVEAAAVAERVLFHAQNHPDLTVGVVAFSEAQASAIEAELDRRRLDLPEFDAFFDSDRLDGFFVKNLENVQGDERDIIIFSVGYGPDETGKFTMGFGPLNNAGGHRRLNVAVTRARRRVEVVASITAADMRHDAGSEGARHLRRYLDFAERGPAALALEVSEGGLDVESPFEDEVARVLRAWGHEVVPQVGTAGYRIDLAIRHPEHPGRFLLGVECDGAMYHSSRVARDRDRLRQEVLEGLGWRIHRIWGTSWYRDRTGQEERLRRALEEALQQEPSKRNATATPPSPPPLREVMDNDAPPAWSREYKVRRPSAPGFGYEMHEREAQADLKRMVTEVVKVEGPVLNEVVLRRVREGWGLLRTGHRIRAAFDQAVADLRRRGLIAVDEHGFLWASDAGEVSVRVPTEDDPDSLRDVSEVPRLELEQAVLGVVSDARRIDREELSVRVARLFGWARRGTGIANALDQSVERLVARGGVLDAGAGWLAPAEKRTEPTSRRVD